MYKKMKSFDLHGLIRGVLRRLTVPRFESSSSYWLNRYAAGGNSGPGSYNHLAEFKAKTINALVEQYNIQSVIEFGCGDGNQLGLAIYPRYLGIDISPMALATCREKFRTDSTKAFKLKSEYANERADLALSLDVIYHLVEDCEFESHMKSLIFAAQKLIVIYSSDTDDNSSNAALHVRHRHFSRWMNMHAKNWELINRIPNQYPYDGDYTKSTFAEFFIYASKEVESRQEGG